MAYDFPSSPAVGTVYAPAGGPSWQWDGTAWKSFQANGEMALNRIAIPGPVASYVYSKPSNLRYLDVEGCGGGGSGSAAIATAASTYSFGASGGGGAWGKKLFAAAALPASVTIVVGAGGASASGGGNAGGATTFGSLITLPGGIGGVQGANTTTTGVIGPTTTTAAPTGVDFGSAGAMGGMTGALPSAWNHIGPGGSTPYGQGSPFLLGSNGQVGGTGYGSGSSGCYNPPSSALKSSIAAQPGIVILTEYLAVAPADVVAGSIQPRGECYLETIGATLTLSRLNGSRLFINGVNELIPAAGITLSPAGTALITLYWIYAYMNAGVMALEYSATAPATDANTGVRIKTGDPSRTLVGAWLSAAAGAWETVLTRGASWFNPKSKTTNSTLVSPTTASASFVELSTSLRVDAITLGAREVRVTYQASCAVSLSTADDMTTIGVDGVTGIMNAQRTARVNGTAGSASIPINIACSYLATEGKHFYTALGAVSASNTGTWSSSWIEVTIQG